MKKILALVLVLMMTLSSTLVLAEQVEEGREMERLIADDESRVAVDVADNFDITLTAPEGYQMVKIRDKGLVLVTFEKADDPAAAVYTLAIAHSELLDGADVQAGMSDLSAEDQEAMNEVLTEDFADATVEMRQTAAGTNLILINENGIETDYALLLTYYKSYLVEMYMEKGSELTEEDIQRAIDILSSTEFVEE